MSYNNTKIPLFRRWVLQNFPFIEQDFDALTDYQLICKVVEYLNTVITSQNEVLETLDEYTAEIQSQFADLYNRLKSYVDGRFDDLDLQAEVDKKLEEMVADGVFDTILAQVIPSNIRVYVDNIEQLKASSLNSNQTVATLGFYTKDDGGSAIYKIEDSGTADDVFSFQLANNKIATLVNKSDFNVLQIGAKRNDASFDNATILNSVLKSGMSNTIVRFPAGIYYTTKLNYAGDNLPTDNFKMIGENATIKMLHTNKTATLKGTYDESFTISYGFDELDFGTSCTVNTIKLEDGKVFFYLAISDATLIPNSLVADMVIKGKNSGFEAYIASIDKADPDGAGTARIYLYAGHNERTKNLLFDVTGSTLNETLIVKNHLGNDYLYIRFNDNVIPSYIAVNNQIKQGDKTARVNNISIVYETIKYIELNCMPEIPVFDAESLYLESGVTFDVYDYSDYTAGLMSLNKFTNSSIEGITFDGNNLEVSKYESDLNRWNSLMTGASKNITIKNCKFINSIMAGIQIGGIGNTNSPARHDFPENILLSNCYFYNNGRGDIEVIDGRHINIEYCNGDGVLDVETNSSEILENITINGCTFDEFTPYSPATSTQSTEVSVINSVFNKIVCQQKINLNLVNCITHYFQPYASVIHATNCAFDFMNGYHGNETMFIENSSFYGLYQSNPASQYGNENIELHNCIIDLSLCNGEQKLWSIKRFALNNSTLISSTVQKTISDNKSIYDFNGVTIKNVLLKGISNSPITDPVSTFNNCKFLATNNTTTTSELSINQNINGCVIKNCYIETKLHIFNVQANFINNVINHTTKPTISGYGGCYVNNLVTDNHSGISWNWIRTGASTSVLKFSNVEFNTTINNRLGVTNGQTAPSVNNVSAGSTGYFVDDTTHALVQLYHSNNDIALRYVDFA